MATKKKLLQAAAGTAAASGGAGGLNVEEVFSTYLYTGNNSSTTIDNGIDLSGEGGLVWTKPRTTGTYTSFGHGLMDTERGIDKILKSHATDAETTISDWASSFNSNGVTFDTSGYVNEGSVDYASWTFRKAPKFFDVVTATAPSSGTLQVSHNLGTTVGCIILKSTSDTDNWVVYHRGMGANYYATMNQTNPWINVTGVFDGVTDTYFTLDPSKNCTAGRTYVAYVFAHNDGDADFGPTGDQDVISCGSFTSDSNGDISVELGWEPQFVLYRRTDQGGVWIMTDTMRGMSVNGGTNINYLAANASNAEANNATGVYPTPTGIGGNFNASANTPAIYIAIRRGPMAVPTDATDVFAIDATYSATSPQYYTGWPVDFWMRYYDRGSSSDFAIAMDRLRGNGTKYLNTSNANGESTFSTIGLAQMEGADLNGTSTSVAWLWRRAPSYFDAVAYSGNGTAGRTVSHNLGVAPEMMWVKRRDTSAADWWVYHTGLNVDGDNAPETDRILLNWTDTAVDNAWLMDTAPTSTYFTLNSFGSLNGSGSNYIAYLFASLDGVSKVGSFSHTSGTPTDVDCGFTSGARFVLWKKTDSTDGWQVYDTTRGIVTGNDPFLQLNSTAAEITGEDLIDPLSSGFTVSANKNSGTYIFYAIA